LSTPIGHAIAALAITSTQTNPLLNAPQRKWLAWLCVLASAPDLDYFIPALSFYQHGGLRITHSIPFSLILPGITTLILLVGGRKEFFPLFVQAIAAGFSHLFLDALVGVQPLPLFFPFITQTYRLPFGILPSAGIYWLNHPLFYRNLLIELGVLVPLVLSLFLLRWGDGRKVYALFLSTILWLISAGFMAWAYSLPR
jgi:membrane-bound metal-dependent hydrolase YbcI (DUF457 family)